MSEVIKREGVFEIDVKVKSETLIHEDYFENNVDYIKVIDHHKQRLAYGIANYLLDNDLIKLEHSRDFIHRDSLKIEASIEVRPPYNKT